MITKKKILSHILWGGIFGLVGGLILLCLEKIKYPGDFTIAVLIIGIFIGVTLGVADKNIRKTIFGILGGIFGAIIYYAFKDIHELAKMLLHMMVLPICIGLFVGIAYSSLKSIILGILAGIIGITVVMFFGVVMALLGWVWTPFMGGGKAFLPIEVAVILMEVVTVVLVATAIFIGAELGEKKSK